MVRHVGAREHKPSCLAQNNQDLYMANTIKAGQSISGKTRWDCVGNSVYKGTCEYSKDAEMSQPVNEDETAPNAFLDMLDSVPVELAHDFIPPGKIKTLLQTSKRIRQHFQECKPRITIRPNENEERLGDQGQHVNTLLESLDSYIENYEVEGVIMLEVYFGNSAAQFFEKLESCKNLTNLEISHCRLTPCQLEEFANVPLHCRLLSRLELCGNKFGDEGVAVLAGMLPRCASLTWLDLAYNHIEDQGVSTLAPILPKCPLLTRLYIFGNMIGDEGVDKLAAVLGQCKLLERLELGYNEICNEGAESLANVLHACTSLSFLGLEMNQIGDEGVYSIFTAVPQCTSLLYLDLRYNEFWNSAPERLYEVALKCPLCEIHC